MRAAVPHLKKRAEFLRVAATRRRCAMPGLVLQVADSADGPRIGFTASKKVGGAVVRNRARRRLRAAVALSAHHFQPGFDYVLIAREATARRPWADLLADLATAGRRLKAWGAGA